MIIKDCLGNEILRYYGAYTHYNTISQPFTYSIAKVVIFYKEEWKNGILDIDYKYEYRLYAYHGLTFDCYESGLLQLLWMGI